MASLHGFDASTVEPNVGFDPVPVGKYKAIIAESQTKDTQDGTGKYLALTFEIIDGDCKGRKIFENLNLENKNAKAVEIALATLSAICRAVNVLRPNDSSELHNLPVVITVAMVRRKDTGEMQNKIRKYESLAAAAAATIGVPAGAPAQATTPNTPPWMKAR